MKKAVKMNLSIPCDLKYLVTVGNTFETFFNHCHMIPPQEKQFASKINLVLTEAIANAINHSNCTSQSGEVIITATIDPDEFILEVTDSGDGFELPQEIRNEPYDESGRGIYIIRQIMDKVENVSLKQSHTLKMTKFFN